MKLQTLFRRYRASRVFTLVLILLYFGLTAQNSHQVQFRVAFYNLENLFHPEHDSLSSDEEFTPDGLRRWSYYRYRQKLNQMAKAIVSIGEWEAPALVGLEELENRQVLADLLATPTLRKIPYRAVHYDSPDRRGIDVALIYRRDLFSLIYSKNIAVVLPNQPEFKTRDILYVKGVAGKRDTIHLFVCHWPSRYGGQAVSEPKRLAAANTLRNHLDSLSENCSNPHIIVGGDFNDEPSNESLLTLCQSDSNSISLTNLMAEGNLTGGSHRHHGIWSFLDQIIVSNSLLNHSPPSVVANQAVVHHPDFLLEEETKYPGYKPYRHFQGFSYHGGFSDHLPVYIDLILTPALPK